MQDSAKYTSEERLWAALSHGSVLLSFFGPLAPFGIWTSQRGKSDYVRFQALQALGYQIVSFWLGFVGWMGITFLFLCIFPILSGALAAADTADLETGVMVVWMLLLPLSMVAMWAVFMGVGLLGAVFCLLGREFRYPVLGGWLESKLGLENGLDEEQEERWLASMCHANGVLGMWGMGLPLAVWVTQKDRSPLLRFQALQALIYQGAATIAYFVGYFLYMISFFVLMLAASAGMWLSAPAGSTSTANPAIGILFLVVIGIILLFWLACALAVPLYYLLAAAAAWRTARGHSYHYPILGRLLEKHYPASGQEKT